MMDPSSKVYTRANPLVTNFGDFCPVPVPSVVAVFGTRTSDFTSCLLRLDLCCYAGGGDAVVHCLQAAFRLLLQQQSQAGRAWLRHAQHSPAGGTAADNSIYGCLYYGYHGSKRW
jgi:hypothetical protein